MKSRTNRRRIDALGVLRKHVHLDRDGSRPLHDQLRSGIELAIFSGEITDGSPLPSIRQLADAFEVAPNTVAAVYRALRDDEWIRSAPKQGYYVTIEPDGNDHPVSTDVTELIDQAVELAFAERIGPSRFMRLVSERLQRRDKRIQSVAIVGYAEAYLAERVELISEAIADLRVHVVGVSFQELEKDPLLADRLEQIDVFLVPVGEVHTARQFLPSYRERFLPMTRELRLDVRSRLAQHPETTCFGVLAGNEEGLDRELAILHRWHPVVTPPLTALTSQPEEINKVIKNADIIVVGSHSRLLFSDYATLPKEVIELVYVPDRMTVRRLRRRLARAEHTDNSSPG